jgi:hypothetical protein
MNYCGTFNEKRRKDSGKYDTGSVGAVANNSHGDPVYFFKGNDDHCNPKSRITSLMNIGSRSPPTVAFWTIAARTSIPC